MDEVLEALEAVAGYLRQVNTERDGLLVERDRLVAELRDAGVSWVPINAACKSKNVQVSFDRRQRKNM